jgi:hypothetical protein
MPRLPPETFCITLFIGLRAIQQLKADNDNIEMRLKKMENRK